MSVGVSPVQSILSPLLKQLLRPWRRLPLLIGLFVVVRLAMLTAFAPVSRYLLPILPFLVIYLAAGLRVCPRAIGGAHRRGLTPPLVVSSSSSASCSSCRPWPATGCSCSGRHGTATPTS